MIHTISLKLNREFKRVYSSNKSAVGGLLVVYIKKNRFISNRLGITVGKSIGKAVKRNRVKRLIRECYRKFEPDLKVGYDIVVVARTRSVDKTLQQIYKDMNYALKKIELIGSDSL